MLNAAIGFLTEWKAEQALAALRKQSVPVAHVVRDGVERQVPAAELVAGDLVILSAGVRLPADGRIIDAARLQVEEAALTGESHAAIKRPDPVPETETALGDRSSMAYMGTTVTDGRRPDVIAEFAKAHHVELIVMGTVARTGIPGLLIGNTAETILQRVDCSVLAVKPDGFVSPVTLVD